MTKKFIQIRLNVELFKKFKVYCAINGLSMTDQTNIIVRNFIEEQNKVIKIINTSKLD